LNAAKTKLQHYVPTFEGGPQPPAATPAAKVKVAGQTPKMVSSVSFGA